MTKEEVQMLYEIWQMTPGRRCECSDHHPENKNICMREKNWRAYCEARDLYIGKRKQELKQIDLGDLFDSIEGLD